jgi:hypothetical protein
MDVIEGGAGKVVASASLGGDKMSHWDRLRFFFTHKIWHWRLKRWVPRLVWLGDEIDVCITFTEDPLQEGNEFAGLFSGGLWEIQKRLHAMGIEFDSGCGHAGRDWQWDWSLSGPVRVKFRGRAKHPERRIRQEAPKPKLVSG